MEKDIDYRALKEAGSKAIQDAFTKAICELTGEDYEVEVNSIDFDATDGAFMYDSTKITVTASRMNQFYRTPDEEKDSASPA